MPSMTRMILIALHAAAIATLTQTALRAVAAPLPLPTTVYMRPALPPRNASRPLSRNMRIIRNVTSSSVPASPHLAFARAISSETEPTKSAASTENSTDDPYARLVSYHQATRQNSKNLKKLAAQSASFKANDAAFQQKCEGQLNAFHANILGQQAALSAIADEKHNKAINSRSNPTQAPFLEAIINAFVRNIKDGLKSSEGLVKNLPILGPCLDPIVYDIKCVLDVILNNSEDLVDALLSPLGL